MKLGGGVVRRGHWVIVPIISILTAASPSGSAIADGPPRASILVFSAGSTYAHISSAVEAVRALATDNGLTVETTTEPAAFTPENLDRYDAVVWLLTAGNVLNADQEQAFTEYIEGGGGFVGVHSAAVTETGWTWYRGLLGSDLEQNSTVQPAQVTVTDGVHPSTSFLPSRWFRTDEWYSFEPNPRGNVHVLASVEESTFSGGVDGFDHPVAWCQNYRGGRSWYTAGGDTPANYVEPLFLRHILGGILWAAGEQPGDCGGTVWSNFHKVALDQETAGPLELDVADDGRVFFVERSGNLKVFDPALGSTVVAGVIPVSQVLEDGLLGLALDPDFERNGWLYLYYAPQGSALCSIPDVGATDCGRSRLSRFSVDGNTLLPHSEKVLLEIPTQRHDGYHAAGSLDFDGDGNLYLSTGDNTSPFESLGYAPIDERAGRAPWDAQRTSANTNDLRGKLLRIHPEPNGTYSIPEGNLFPPGTADARPEIYAMGFRNPFRFSVDEERGWVYLADYGPDAIADDAVRGPRGYVEWNVIRSAGNYGWPHCVANNVPYMDFDFDTSVATQPFDCAAPSNDSPNNTGLEDLPAARPATLWYSYALSTEFPELESGWCACPMGGPAYEYDPTLDSDRKFPAYYDNTPFFYEWGRKFIREIQLDDSGGILDINKFLPGLTLDRPIDMTFGPDGAMYVLEWGNSWVANDASGLYRIDYVADAEPPVTTPEVVPASADPEDPALTATLHSLDDSGVARIRYSLDGAAWQTYGAPLTIDELGRHTLRFRATDAIGNVEPTRWMTIRVGQTLAPAETVGPDLTDASDADPGVGRISCVPSPRTLSDRGLVKVRVDLRTETGAPLPEGLVLTGVWSNRWRAAGDMRGWRVGTLDTTGRLRVADEGPRRYFIEYADGGAVGCLASVRA